VPSPAVIPLVYGFDPLYIEVDGRVARYIWLVRGLAESPRARGTDVIVPTSPFRVARSRVFDTLTIELEGYVFGAGDDEDEQRADFAERREIIKALLDPREYRDLVATLEDGSVATIAARTLNRIVTPIAPAVMHVSVELEAATGDWVIEVPGS
jgi:hypothetical protein